MIHADRKILCENPKIRVACVQRKVTELNMSSEPKRMISSDIILRAVPDPAGSGLWWWVP